MGAAGSVLPKLEAIELGIKDYENKIRPGVIGGDEASAVRALDGALRTHGLVLRRMLIRWLLEAYERRRAEATETDAVDVEALAKRLLETWEDMEREDADDREAEPAPVAVAKQPASSRPVLTRTVSEMDDFRAKCLLMVNKTTMLKGHTFLVAVDLSKDSDAAVLSAIHLRQGADRIVLVHVYDAGGDPQALKAHYDAMLTGHVREDRFKIKCISRQPEQSIKELVVASANTYDAAYRTEEGQGTLFVTGYKHEAQTGERSVMGETDDLVTRGVAHPTLVCKRQVLARDGRTFVCCVRDSAIAWNAYLVTLALIKPKDKLVLYSVTEHERDAVETHDGLHPGERAAEELRAKFETDIEDRGLVDATFVMENNKAAVPVHQQLLDFIEARSADYVVIGEHAKNPGYQSENAERIVNGVACNVIIVKS